MKKKKTNKVPQLIPNDYKINKGLHLTFFERLEGASIYDVRRGGGGGSRNTANLGTRGVKKSQNSVDVLYESHPRVFE